MFADKNCSPALDRLDHAVRSAAAPDYVANLALACKTSDERA
jgi:hypothetical protein